MTSRILTASALGLALLVVPDAPARAASAGAALAQLANPVVNDGTLKRMIGSWRGDGTARRGSGDGKEKVSCRLTNSWASGNRLMQSQLSCRGIDFSFSSSGYVGRSGGTYRGAWSGGLGANATARGSGSSSGLHLTITSVGRSAETASMSISVSGSRITTTVSRRDPDTRRRYRALSISLRK
jgi:hypothetical protein